MEKRFRIEELSDGYLLEGMLRHDDAAFETIYRLYYPVTLQLVTQNNGTEDDAKDLFQEAIMVLYEKSKDPSFSLQCKLKTFLYSVCRHLWLKKLRSRHTQINLSDETAETIPVEEDTAFFEEQDAKFRVMEHALGSLGEPCRTLLEDYYIRKQSMQNIALKFGYTNTDNAKNQKYKCLMRLKKIFFTQYKKEGTM